MASKKKPIKNPYVLPMNDRNKGDSMRDRRKRRPKDKRQKDIDFE